ncbi:hypothetical protein ACJRO7_030269 [Eucalyptus globulus]|uniref:Gnk2-homologous domain-containing protein n=1 Tax=Eucalyptus globulus TaxID=34317 RepID=A0ABD3JG39_EUCGL
MATSQRIVGLTFVLLWIGNVVSGTPDMSEMFFDCNLATYQYSDPFAYSLTWLLSTLEDVTPSQQNYDYYAISPYLVLSFDDCSTCLFYAHGHVLDECPMSIGAQLELPDCKVRYEQYLFTD